MPTPKRLYKTLVYFILTAGLAACGHVIPPVNNYSTTDTSSKSQLESLHQSANKKQKPPSTITDIRLEGLKEMAMALGAQGALAHRATKINTMLENNHGEMDQVYNFQALMLPHDILPPVLTEGQRTLNKNDNNTIRMADKTYRIVQQAQFATAPPNWRNYLLLTYEKPELPAYQLLPREQSLDEIKAWKAAIDEGWEQGSKQANQIFAENLARLQRDYNGMVLYRRLVNYQMITNPVVAETDLGITGGGEEMSINDRFKRITQSPGLIPDTNEWRPTVAQAFNSLGNPKPPPSANIVPDMKPMKEAQMQPTDPSTYVK